MRKNASAIEARQLPAWHDAFPPDSPEAPDRKNDSSISNWVTAVEKDGFSSSDWEADARKDDPSIGDGETAVWKEASSDDNSDIPVRWGDFSIGGSKTPLRKDDSAIQAPESHGWKNDSGIKAIGVSSQQAAPGLMDWHSPGYFAVSVFPRRSFPC